MLKVTKSGNIMIMLKNLDQMQSHANYGKSTMETGDHSKNGASLKSLMSKRNSNHGKQ
jgi:hypothetical protein